MNSNHELILIADYGSQYTQLIARRIREQQVFCRIITPQQLTPELLTHEQPKGVVLSGGPNSVYQANAPLPNPKIFDQGIPTLGICYGMQAMVHILGGAVERAGKREYGKAVLIVSKPNGLFNGAKPEFVSWMSHGDAVAKLPEGFVVSAQTHNTGTAAMANLQQRLYGLQFHPEVAHTEEGRTILANFLFKICGCRGDWTMAAFIEESVQAIRANVGKAHVVLGLSGGVDSSVAAVLLHRAIGQQLTCVFVDNGLLRHGEWTMASFIQETIRRIRQQTGESGVILGLSGGVDSSVAAVLLHQAIGKALTCVFGDNGLLRSGERTQIEETFGRHFQMNLRVVNATDRFLRRLEGTTDPERKRKLIGEEFVRVFEAEARTIPGTGFLGQGTLYPDVIESQSAWGGPSATIKTHHNVGGLPKDMQLALIEPLRDLFKDEVREVGRLLGLPNEILLRHPFPGPGLAVRILGEVTPERLRMVREADERVIEEIRRAGLYDMLWLAFAVLLPVKAVGVMGDERTYEHVIAVRAVTSVDAMTADWAKLPAEVLEHISNRIINEVKGINRVVYDISSKPPATIEWE